ncbi:diguanylate cyclase domain-containing protein [Enterovibrio sp. 27052020O]|uniref:diguanylate cyclase domain-containing protein n=1 Tax=Enterovibrio sp. 27052020O TaxID=3241166 RepID=UPI00388DDC1E
MIFRFLNNLPLRVKFVLPTWLLMTAGVMFLGMAVDHIVGKNLEKSLISRATVMANAAASNLTAAIAFGDMETGREQLTALSADPDLIAARVVSPNHVEFVSFLRLPIDCGPQDNTIACTDTATEYVVRPIVLGKETLGKIELYISRETIDREHRILLAYLAIGTGLLSFFSLMFAQLLHQFVASPLASLHQSMSAIIRLGVLNRTIPVRHDDELGQLTTCFNEMVMNLSERDSQLKQTLKELEKKSRYISQVLDTMEHGVIVASPGDKVTYYNPAAANQLSRFGCSPTDLDELLVSFEPVSSMMAISRAVDKHLPLTNVELTHTETGTIFLVSTHPMASAQHSLLQFDDITAHREAEQRRKLAELIFDKSPNATLVLSRSLEIKTQNTVSVSKFGANSQWATLVADGQPNVRFRELKVLMSKGSYQWQRIIISATGASLPCKITVQTLSNHRRKVEGFVVSIVDQSVEVEIKRLNYLANHDGLTGLSNRASAFEKLTKNHDKGRNMYVLFIDLDGFKAVNDQYGHKVGDELLKVVASRMKASVSRSDFVSRLSGDEFLIAIHDTSTIHHIVKRLLNKLNQVMIINGCQPKVSASIGVRFWPSVDTTPLSTVVEQADKAMYHAKAKGKNCYSFAKAGKEEALDFV